MASSPAFAQSSPSPYTTGYRYDALGREVGVIRPDPDDTGPLGHPAVRKTYDAAGRLIRVDTGELSAWQSEAVAPAAWPGFTVFQALHASYDAMGRKVKAWLVAGGATRTLTQMSYDDVGRLSCTAVRMNPAQFASPPAAACSLDAQGGFGPDRITRNVYDAAGQLLTVQKAYGTPLQQDYVGYAYSPNGKVTSVTDANGNKASMTYDGHDRQVRWSFPSKTTPGQVSTTDYEAYLYDANGNRTRLRKRDGRTILYSYDALNRVTLKNMAGTAADVYYGYDHRGLQLYARFGSASGEGITTQYDGFGRIVSSSSDMDGTVRTLGYQYDANSNRTRITHPDGVFFTYGYDGLDRLKSIWINGNGVIVRLFYDAEGRREELRRGAGETMVITDYAYGPAGRLETLTDRLDGTAHDLVTTLAYNPAHQIAARTRSNDAYAFADHVEVGRAYQANGLNQYVSAGSAVFTYDANGNLTSDGATTYVYDIENRLVSASGASSASLVYDPLGRLFQTAGGGLGMARFLYDGDALVAEYDGAGNLVRRYVHGPGVDEPLIWYEGAGVTGASRRWLQADHQGSIVSVADNAGAAIAVNSYDPYGIPGVGNLGRFQYTGQIMIPELWLYHYKARLYSPTLGRFMQTDPIGYDGGINLYAYVRNDPVNLVDPSGENPAVDRRADDLLGLVILLTEASKPDRTADDELRRGPHGERIPDPEAEGSPHTQLGTAEGRRVGKHPQAREFDEDGNPVRDIDFTDHGRPQEHENPHQHRWIPNPTGGTPQRGPAEPLPELPKQELPPSPEIPPPPPQPKWPDN